MNAEGIDRLLETCEKAGIPMDFGLVLRTADYGAMQEIGLPNCRFNMVPHQPWTRRMVYRGVVIQCESILNRIPEQP